MSTSPLGSSAAAALSRAVFIVGSEAAGAKLLLAGSYSSTLLSDVKNPPSPAPPPAIKHLATE
jgi:hypothetical protein